MKHIRRGEELTIFLAEFRKRCRGVAVAAAPFVAAAAAGAAIGWGIVKVVDWFRS